MGTSCNVAQHNNFPAVKLLFCPLDDVPLFLLSLECAAVRQDYYISFFLFLHYKNPTCIKVIIIKLNECGIKHSVVVKVEIKLLALV